MKTNIATLFLLLVTTTSISTAQHLRATREVAGANEIDPSQTNYKGTASPTDSLSHAPSFESTTPPTLTSSNPTTEPITPNPSASPTLMPTTSSPTQSPTPMPTTSSPTQSPTLMPTTSSPTQSPTLMPTTSSPTQSPTLSPTVIAPPAPGRDQSFAIIAGNNVALSVDNTDYFCGRKFLVSQVFFRYPRASPQVRFRWKYDPDTKQIESLACPGKVLDIIDCGRGDVRAFGSSSYAGENQQWDLEFLGGEQWALRSVFCQRFLLSGSPAHIGNSEEEKAGFTLQIIQ